MSEGPFFEVIAAGFLGFRAGDTISPIIVHDYGPDEWKGRSLNLILKILWGAERTGKIKGIESPAEQARKREPNSIYSQETKSESNEAAFNLLRDPNLIDKFQEQFDKRIVGEHESRLVIFLNCCGIWVKNHSIASYNLCLNSESGAGKDYVAKNILRIFPQSRTLFRSRISQTALTYWHNSKFEPEWTWDGKAMLLSDISYDVLNCDVFKLFCSDETTSTITINNKATDITINGKPVMLISTAEGNMKHQMVRRFPMVQLDESRDQTRKIKMRQAELAAKGVNPDYDKVFIEALSLLEEVEVMIPFAGEIVNALPDEHIIMRTHFGRFLDYIKASAAMHQFQRQIDEAGRVIAEEIDYEYARQALIKTTSNRLMIPLNKKQKRLLEIGGGLLEFTVSQIAPKVPFLSEKSIYKYLNFLQESGFIASELRDVETSKKPVRIYKVIEGMALSGVPNWDEIHTHVMVSGKTTLNTPSKINTIDTIDTINPEQVKQLKQFYLKSWPSWDDDALVHLPCVECDATPCNTGLDGKPYCYGCWGQKDAAEEEVK